MFWPVLKEFYLQRLETYYPGSDHNANIRRVLDRFTARRNLIDRSVQSIEQIELELYIASRRGDRWRNQPLTTTTLNNEVTILNAVFAFAGPKGHKKHERNRLGLMPSPPWLAHLPEDDLAPVELTEQQIAKCLDATRHAKTPRVDGCSPATFWICTLILAGLTLLRRNALLKIPRPDDVMLLEQRRLFLPAGINKTRRDVWVSLGSHDQLVELFAALPSKVGEPLLPWKDRAGRPMTLSHFNHCLAKFQRVAGIPEAERVRTKDFRSTSATLVGDEFGDAIAKRKLAHSPNTNTFEKHYKGRKPTSKEVAATDYIADILISSLRNPPPPQPQPSTDLRVIG